MWLSLTTRRRLSTTITIEVKGGADSDMKSTLDVTVTVTDVDEVVGL